MKPALLDTDTLSEIMKGRNPAVLGHAREYLAQFGAFSFSMITRYEILRGLKAKHAGQQLAQFEQRCAVSRVLPLTDEIIVRAADFYAVLRRRGVTISDADLLIAATAVCNDLALATNNLGHFRKITELTAESWAVA